MKRLILFAAFVVAYNVLSAQEHEHTQRCHTDEIKAALIEDNPALETAFNEARNLAHEWANDPSNTANRGGVVTIPVVVHVIYDGEPVGTGANISDAQVLSQIDVLNEDYRKLNPDVSSVPSYFSSVTADCGIEFCMASIDPNGNPTTGIDRVDWGPYSNFDSEVKPATIWNRNNYLNIWVTDLGGGLLGYAIPPGGSPSTDGVVIGYQFFGKFPANPYSNDFNLGRTATHEIGHWLGLDHTFSGGCAGTNAGNCGFAGDGICDTPPTDGPNYGCVPFTQNTCTETPTDQNDMPMNYMDYSDDDCLFMFTNDQAAVMNGVLSTTRSSLLTSPACASGVTFTYSGQVIDAATSAPVPDASVIFYSNTFQYEVTTNALGNFTVPSMQEGTYDVYAGKWGYMENQYAVGSFFTTSTAGVTIPIQNGVYFDDFILDLGWTETSTATTGDWERVDPVGTTTGGSLANPEDDSPGDYGPKAWVTGNGGGGVGNDDVDDGTVILRSPLMDLSSYDNPYILYDRWFVNTGGSGTPDDELVIKITNGALTNVVEAITTSSPNWVYNEFRVRDYLLLGPNIQIIVETSDGTVGHIVEAGFDWFEVEERGQVGINKLGKAFAQMGVFPNPIKDVVNVDIKMETADELQLKLYNTVGQLMDVKELGQVQQRLVELNMAGYAQGVYLIELTNSQGESMVQRVSKL